MISLTACSSEVFPRDDNDQYVHLVPDSVAFLRWTILTSPQRKGIPRQRAPNFTKFNNQMFELRNWTKRTYWIAEFSKRPNSVFLQLLTVLTLVIQCGLSQLLCILFCTLLLIHFA
ncbi:hypothetical protein PGT21_007391 [Puccinia graminis f. sp. tritici]|uniref:Uncharacterized protein n=1 Tax=Puccinia graminis f. sp. tritici TaxID=56615 RepID=A0A5B0NHD4_PUCGR|nr:hypothetical protein PGTUg99_027356 [Puccinia graminis f. sp. tritici]KAA1101109.1 hypothetical protein PGT21_007391 [Puccinia graminis f. sp. tritici]